MTAYSGAVFVMVKFMKIQTENIFESAEGYVRARIPGIVTDGDGDIFAYCELRRSDSDWAVIDIGMKKSTDGGKTWSQRYIIVSGGTENTVNNPVMIADGNILHFLYCVNYHRVFYMKSADKGESWTNAREITKDIEKSTEDFFWSCIATGPCHGIRLSSGRLIVPLWLAYNKEDNKSHHPSVICVLFSDDSGDTWQTGTICNSLTDPSEFCVAQINSGRIVASVRHEGEKKCRAFAQVNDNCEISEIRFEESLPDPVCCAGMCSYGEELLFSNCADEKSRCNLTLRRLDGNNNIIESFPLSELAGYSDISLSADSREAYVLFEYENIIKFVRVSL